MKLSYDDRKHAYYLDGKRCKGVSTVAKIPDDTYSLDQWRKRQILVGVATEPQLAERAAAHFDERDQLDRIAEEALAAAKSHEAAARGTAAHRITERIDLGEQIIDTPQARAVHTAWLRALDEAGLEVVPELIERIVVYPELRIAGRFDRLCRRKADGALTVVDLKTGASAIKYPHSTAIQLALYANAPILAGPLPREGGTTEDFEEMPSAVDKTIGYVIHMPSDAAVAVHGVDLSVAKTGMDLSLSTLEWRKRTDLLIPVTEVAATTPSPRADDDELQPRRQYVRGLIANLPDEAKKKVAARWPANTPTFKKEPWTHTASQLDAIQKVIHKVEDELSLPFQAPYPPAEPPTATNPPEPKPEPSPPASDEMRNQLLEQIKGLSKPILGRITKRKNDLGIPNIRTPSLTVEQAEQLAIIINEELNF